MGMLLQISGWAYAEAGEPRHGLEDLSSALTSIASGGSRLWEGITLVCMGRAYRALGETDRAREHFERALAIGREIDARASIAEAMDELGQLWAARDETGANTAGLTRAVGYYEQALTIWDEVGSPHYEGRTLWNMSVALDALGERGRAIEAADKALALLQPLEHPVAERVRQKLAGWRGGEHPGIGHEKELLRR